MPPRRLALALALIALARPAVAAEPRVPDLPIDSYRLPNGLKVVLHRDPAVPRVTVMVGYHVGSKNERAGRTGFAHFFEHMMFRGTEHVPDYDVPLQEAGAQSNAFTSEDMTVYFETVPSNFLERALYLEAERLAFLPSALDQQKFDTEREVVKNERRQRNENVPYGLAEEAILASVFPDGHPYSWSVIGSMEDLNRATLEDLRRFFAEFYHPANATLCLAGDFDPEQAKALIEKYFGVLRPGPNPPNVEAPPAPPVAKRLTQIDDVKLPRVYWAWPTVADAHDDAPALGLLAEILSGGDASRLHRALVLDAQAAQDVDASSDTKEIAGLFTVDATAVPGMDIEEVERLLGEQIERLRTAEPSAEELDRALAKFEKSTFAAMTPPLMRAVNLVVGFAQHDDPAYYREDIARYYRVTPADIRRVAREYLVPETVVLVVRPPMAGESESQAVQAGPKPSPTPERPAMADREPLPGPDWSTLPGPDAPRPFNAPMVVRAELSNGLDLRVVPWKTLPIVHASLLVPVGSADDPEGRAGLAELTATMLDKGTARRTAVELAEAFDALGATVSVSAGPDTTTVGLSSLARNLDGTLALIAEMLRTPRFDPEDFARERQLHLTELLRGPDNPGWIARRAFRALLYGPDHPYGRPADGRPETVETLSVDDVRTFYRDRFGPGHATLIVVGDVDPAALKKSLESTLGTWMADAPAPRERPRATHPATPGVIYLADKPGAVQSILSVGRRWIDREDPRYFATLIGNHILGADFLSRLNANLRVKHGFSYGVGSLFLFRRTGSVWAAQTAVRADATAPALRELLAELDALDRARPFTPEEIATARAAEVRSFPDAFETPAGIAGVLAEQALFDLPDDYLETYLDKLQAVPNEAIQRAMSEVVSAADRVILVVGDRKALEPELKALNLGEVRVVTPDGQPAAP